MVAVHIKGDIITGDGLIDVLKAQPLARLGYHQYTSVQSVFEMEPPLMPDDTVSQAVLSGDAEKMAEAAKSHPSTWRGSAAGAARVTAAAAAAPLIVNDMLHHLV